MTEKLREHLERWWPDFSRFINNSHVLRLAYRGRLRRAYRTKLATIADHETRLEIYRQAAITETDWNRIRFFEREIERLRTESDIIEEAMDFLDIAF